MANYYVKRTNLDGSNVVYMAADGTWVATTGAAFVTTTQGIADTIAAALNTLQLNVSAFFGSPAHAFYNITEITV